MILIGYKLILLADAALASPPSPMIPMIRKMTPIKMAIKPQMRITLPHIKYKQTQMRSESKRVPIDDSLPIIEGFPCIADVIEHCSNTFSSKDPQ